MNMNRRHFHRLLVSGAALGASGAAPLASARPGGEEGSARTGRIFTITNSAAGNELLVFGNDGGGALVLLGALQTLGLGSGSGLGSQGAVTLSADGRWLFAVNAGSHTVSTFALRGGGLSLASTVDSMGLRPISVAERNGLVYVLNADGTGNVAGFHNQRGTLLPLADGVRPLSAAGGTAPAQVAISPDGDLMVVTEKATSKLLSYLLDSDGTASAPVVTPSAGSTPFGFAFDRRGRIVVTEAVASTVSTYRFAEGSAVPVLVSNQVATGEGAACWAAVTPNGRYAYSGNASTHSLSLFGISRSATATLLAGAAASTGAGGGAGDIAIAGHGRTLAVLAPRTPAILRFDVGSDGGLTAAGSVAGLPAGVVGLAAN